MKKPISNKTYQEILTSKYNIDIPPQEYIKFEKIMRKYLLKENHWIGSSKELRNELFPNESVIKISRMLGMFEKKEKDLISVRIQIYEKGKSFFWLITDRKNIIPSGGDIYILLGVFLKKIPELYQKNMNLAVQLKRLEGKTKMGGQDV